jgi:hypothetical protein
MINIESKAASVGGLFQFNGNTAASIAMTASRFSSNMWRHVGSSLFRACVGQVEGRDCSDDAQSHP